jgi:hypothetical protein
MKTVGKRREFEPNGTPSAENLLRGARMNEAMQKLPTGTTTFIPRGKVYFFKTHAEANLFQDTCIVEGIARMIARKG